MPSSEMGRLKITASLISFVLLYFVLLWCYIITCALLFPPVPSLSPFSASLVLSNNVFGDYGLVTVAYPSTDSMVEVIIQRTIDGIQRMISLHNNQGEIEKGKGKGTTTATTTTKEAPIQISLAAKRHWESEIKILRDAPRDPEKLRQILKAKQKEYEEAEDSEDIERLIPQIEMLKFVLFLVSRVSE